MNGTGEEATLLGSAPGVFSGIECYRTPRLVKRIELGLVVFKICIQIEGVRKSIVN